MSRSIKKIVKYIKMSCLLMVLVVPISIFAGIPVYSHIRSQVKMIITKGSPNYGHSNTFVAPLEQLEEEDSTTVVMKCNPAI